MAYKANEAKEVKMHRCTAQRDQIVIIIISFIGNKQKRVVRKVTNFDFASELIFFSFIFIALHSNG